MTSRRRKVAARRREKQQKDTQAGAPPLVPPAFLLVGKLARPHGVRGEMLMIVLTDFPERLTPDTILYMGDDHQPVTLISTRHHNNGLLATLEGITTREEATQMHGQLLFVRADDRPPLPEGEFYLHELLGLMVVSDQGEDLGQVVDWIETGANGVFVVRKPEGGDLLLPDIDDVVLKVDKKNGVMTVHLLEGLV